MYMYLYVYLYVSKYIYATCSVSLTLHTHTHFVSFLMADNLVLDIQLVVSSLGKNISPISLYGCSTEPNSREKIQMIQSNS